MGQATCCSNSWAERQVHVVDSYYMVPVIDGDDKVRSVKAMGVDCIATLAATDVPTDIGRRLPQAKGFEEKLASQREMWIC